MSQHRTSGWAIGWTYFAAFMMVLIGAFHALAGVFAVIDDAFYDTPGEYFLQFDASTWGWIHLILGVVVVLAGFALFSGAVWARTVGVVMAMISAIVAFAWLPWHPVMAVILIAVAVSVIWALTAHGRDVTGLE
ncbi:MAG TPA: hypothetical protein VIB62_10170 [Actinomycetota bacterium]|jgi:hypothetical protein